MNGLGGPGHTFARPSANKIMQPRIYTYKITFEEIPDWYWGAHKEEKYDDGYLGSPETHAWKWEFYTPHLEICELFSYTDEGWAEALKVEKRCIKPDLNNALCLNENVGGLLSLEANRKGARKMNEALHAEKDEFGKSVQGVRNGERLHEEKDEVGRCVNSVKGGKKAAKKLHKEKDELGRSVNSVKGAAAANKEKDEFGRSVNAMKAMSQVWESTVDGFRSHSCGVARHNKANGWDPAARIKIS